MKKLHNLKWFLFGIVAFILISSFINAVFAASTEKRVMVELIYRDIKITLDGDELIPKDAQGNVVEPFIIGGTTYLPVRGISNALGFDVDWNDETSTVILTSDYVPVTEIIVIDDFGTGGLIPIATIGSTYELPITVLPENATYKELAFSSSNPDFVSVDENGLLTALDFGCSIITVTVKDGVSVSVHVDSGRRFVRLSESNELILKKGDVFDLNNTFLTNPASERDNIIWISYDLTGLTGETGNRGYSYDKNVSTRATVENGIITCLKPGLVVVHRKLICEHIKESYSEWFLTIEE